jgi:hypothetical protein
MMRVFAFALLAGCSPGTFMPVYPHFERSEVPLTVCVSAYEGDAVGARKLADYAITTAYTDRLGFKLYTMQPAGSQECDATLIVGVPAEAGWRDPAGTCEFDPTQITGTRCQMATSNTGQDDMTTLAIEHELGHCAGLAHDDWIGSIMYPELHETPIGEFPPWLSDHERELLRQRFAAPR